MPLEMGEALVVGGLGRVTHRLATALNHCMSAVGGGASLVAAGVTRIKATALGRWGVTSGVPAALVEEGVPWVIPTALLLCSFGALAWGKNNNKSRKGTSNMAGQQGEEQLERDADINRLDRTHHVAGEIGFQVSTVDLSRYKHVGLRQWRCSREPSEWVELGIYNGEWQEKFDPVIVPLNISRLNERRSILRGNAMAEI
ncbi:hypothetical protein PIB30_078999 [Stylosanthes scabra]|uniref:Uncharacterized protein n=1 Tax=Stylosanthes scabra TaxID=79078 RepID=A0ABU6URT4_9FABA|nr:hypothetical protein [Stylosanthes scabra]